MHTISQKDIGSTCIKRHYVCTPYKILTTYVRMYITQQIATECIQNNMGLHWRIHQFIFLLKMKVHPPTEMKHNDAYLVNCGSKNLFIGVYTCS